MSNRAIGCQVQRGSSCNKGSAACVTQAAIACNIQLATYDERSTRVAIVGHREGVGSCGVGEGGSSSQGCANDVRTAGGIHGRIKEGTFVVVPLLNVRLSNSSFVARFNVPSCNKGGAACITQAAIALTPMVTYDERSTGVAIVGDRRCSFLSIVKEEVPKAVPMMFVPVVQALVRLPFVVVHCSRSQAIE